VSDPLLEVRDLEKHYPITQGVLNREVGRVRAVDGVSFRVDRGETVGLVGESGCGKSTVATSILRLEEPTGGDVRFDGDSLLELSASELKSVRRRAQMIFQDAESTLDPRMTVGESVVEPLRIHGIGTREERRAVTRNLLERVGMEADDVDRYPHSLSGGQKQRVALARALVLNPELVVADEPVSALDVSVQSKIIRLLNEVGAEFGLSMLVISHDMGVVRELCDRVAVMYLGELVEVAPTEALFADAQHPYTRALVSAIPSGDPRRRGGRVRLSGDVPSPSDPPSGCRFHTRCPMVVQPDGYEFEQAAWRAVMDLRGRLEGDGVDVAGAREFVATQEERPEASVTDDEVRAAIADEFGLPDSIDGDAGAVLSTALDDLVEGDQDAARALLAEEFASICEATPPETTELAGERRASCHLHRDDVPGSVDADAPRTDD
jgi:peptide/nickel transport system ATP-binding protein